MNREHLETELARLIRQSTREATGDIAETLHQEFYDVLAEYTMLLLWATGVLISTHIPKESAQLILDKVSWMTFLWLEATVTKGEMRDAEVYLNAIKENIPDRCRYYSSICRAAVEHYGVNNMEVRVFTVAHNFVFVYVDPNLPHEERDRRLKADPNYGKKIKAVLEHYKRFDENVQVIILSSAWPR